MVKVEGIDPAKKVINTPVGSLTYDYLVLACGSKTNFFGLEGIRRKSFPLKKIVHALNLRSHILQNFEKAVLTEDSEEQAGLMNFVVVGGGPTGVEVAGALGELKNHVLPNDFPDLNFELMQVSIIEAGPRLLADMSEHAGEKAEKYLKEFGIKVILNCQVKDYDGHTVVMNDRQTINSQTMIWAAGVHGDIVSGVPESVIESDRITVNAFNQVEGSNCIFAIGDIALMKDQEYPRGHPMVAQVAIQQGRHLARNFKALLNNLELKPFRYIDKGSMATIGRNKAVVDIPFGLRFGGHLAWLVWMFVHLFALIGFRNKMVTLINWFISYVTFDKGNRLIIRRFDKERVSPVEAQ
jgi:NADH dehydrogenase